MREKSLLCPSLSDAGRLTVVMEFDLFPGQEPARASGCYSSLHLTDMTYTMLLYIHSKVKQSSHFSLDQLLSTSLTKRGEQLTPGITNTLQVKETFSKCI